MKVEIDILNYNGAELLKECLPSIAKAAEKSSHNCRLVIVDNCSTDESEAIVNREFPDFTFYKAQENKVLCTFNEIAKVSDADITIFLNNDLKVDEGFIDPLIDIFLNKDNVFLVAPRVYNFDRTSIMVGRTKPFIKWGIFKTTPEYKVYEKDINDISYTLLSGFGAFDRKKFLKLGGYDSLYLPGIYEDTDIGFRAWRRGYKSYYQPKSHVYHKDKASFRKRFGGRKLLAISHRNTYLFMWKNITDKKIILANIMFILPRMLRAFVYRKWEIIWGFTWALTCLFKVLPKRAKEKTIEYKLNTKDVLRIFSDKTWGDFYNSVIDSHEFSRYISIHKDFFDQILKGKPSKVIEVGTGTGIMATFLSSKINSVVSIDNNNKILTNARENNKRFKSKVEFKEADAFHLDFPDNNFDIAFSQGFFEHFSDFDINLLLKEQLRVAKKVIFSVPTFYYRNRDFGNERLLLKRHWRDILKDFNVTDDGYYLYTRRRKNLLLELPMMYMATVER